MKEHPDCEGSTVDWQVVVDDMEAALATIVHAKDKQAASVKFHFALFTASDKLWTSMNKTGADAKLVAATKERAWSHLSEANRCVCVARVVAPEQGQQGSVCVRVCVCVCVCVCVLTCDPTHPHVQVPTTPPQA